jgi:hypothetical protein
MTPLRVSVRPKAASERKLANPFVSGLANEKMSELMVRRTVDCSSFSR